MLVDLHLLLQLQVQLSNPSNFAFDLLSFFTDLQLLALHALVHLVERLPLLIEVAILLGEDLLVVVEEAAEVIKF